MAGYEFGATNGQRERLAELGSLLTDCRTVFIAAFDDGMLDPREHSQTAHDFALRLSGPGGPWPEDVNIRPRALAAKLVRQQVDYCVSLGVTVGAGEVFDPMSSLVRGIVEYGTRAFWVIDPSVNDAADTEAGHRIRSARTMLTELVSVHHYREALSDREDVDEARARLKQSWRRLRDLARAMFANVAIDGDPGRWSLEDVAYQSWTAIASTWAALEGSGVHGGRLYQLLAVESHPQGFMATRGLRPSEDGPVRAVTMDDVETRVQLGVVATYSALTLLANYHDYSSPIIADWEARIEATLPGAFRS
jgi:hypothetical protein